MPSLTPKTDELFAVARNGVPITDEGSADIAGARAALERAQDGMRAAGLEPDVELVTVERKITFGRPKRYVDEAAAPIEPAVDEAPGETPPGQ